MRKTQFILLIVCMLFSTGCVCTSWNQLVGKQIDLIGKWRPADSEQSPKKLVFKWNRKFKMDVDGDDQKDVWGKFEFFEGYLRFDDARPESKSDCKEAGFYEFNIQNDELKLVPFAEECDSRRANLNTVWKRIRKPRVSFEPAKPREVKKTNNQGNFPQGVEKYN